MILMKIGLLLVLEKGEIAIAHTTVSVNEGGMTVAHPALLMKVGDGVSLFKDLPWLSAKAADVVAACKNETELTAFVNSVIAKAGIASDSAMKELATKVTTVENAIDTLELLVGTTSVQDQITAAIAALNLADTYAAKKHTHVKADITDFAHTHEIDEVNGLADALADAEDNAKAHADNLDAAMNTRVQAIEALVAGDGEGTIAEQIEAAVAAEATARATAITDAINAEVTARNAAIESEVAVEAALARAAEKVNADAIKAISDDYLKASDKEELEGKIKTNADAIKLLQGVDADTAASVKDLVDYVTDHGPEVTGMKADIASNAAAIKALQDANAEGGAVANAIAAVDAKADANAAAIGKEVTDRAAAITEALNTAADDASTKASAAETNAKAHAETKAAEAQAAAATDATTKANQALEDAKADATTKASAAQTAAESKAAELADAAEANAKKYVDDLKIDETYATKTELNQAKNDLTTEINKKANDADLAAIAKTGSTDNLVQGAMVLVFDCGTSAV